MVQGTAWKKTDSLNLNSTPKGSGNQARPSIVWDVKLCPFEPYTDIFAVVASSDVYVMRAGLETGFKTLSCCSIQPQLPGNGITAEIIYCCEWMLLSNGALCLVAGGHSGIIYLLNAANDLEVDRLLQGHGNSIVRILCAYSSLCIILACI
jgi:hypothetical protein